MNTPLPSLPVIPPANALAGVAFGGSLGAVFVVVNEVAIMEHAPLTYYLAGAGLLGFVVTVVKVWSWVEDRWKKEIQLCEIRLNTTIKTEFAAFAALEDERHKRLEDMIREHCRETREGTSHGD